MHTDLGGQMSPQGAFHVILLILGVNVTSAYLFSALKRIEMDVTQWQHGTTSIIKHFVIITEI